MVEKQSGDLVGLRIVEFRAAALLAGDGPVLNHPAGHPFRSLSYGSVSEELGLGGVLVDLVVSGGIVLVLPSTITFAHSSTYALRVSQADQT